MPKTQDSKRKRAYGHRSRTGCLTCRRRKKKCNEERPACENCVHGGFFCEGYTTGRTWRRLSPLASPSAKAFPPPPLPSDGDSTSPDSDAPVLVESRSTTPQPKNGVSTERPSVGTPATEESPVRREATPPSTAALPSATAEIKRSPDHSPCRRLPPGYLNPNGHPTAQAHLAHSPESHVITGLQQHQQRLHHAHANSSIAKSRSEKAKMLNCEPFQPHDPQLVRDRESCQVALWRYTNSRNPSNAISPEERTKLLKYIFLRSVAHPPVPSPNPSPQSSNTPLQAAVRATRTSTAARAAAGSLDDPPSRARTPPPSYPGNGSTPAPGPVQTTLMMHGIGLGSSIEPPFNCHYGYNIRIGVDVHISQNCLFMDDCQITIGSHTWIGPGLTIVTSCPAERRGEQSSYQGRPVIIEDQCFIAPSVTIMPGVHIGKGATVGPGQVVTASIPAQTP